MDVVCVRTFAKACCGFMYYFLGIKYLGICKYYTLSLKILNTTKPEVHILEIYSLVYILGGSEKWKKTHLILVLPCFPHDMSCVCLSILLLLRIL